MGHASIAEHATFNFDLEGISRLAIEEVEHSRLASYTERSQRYVLIGRDLCAPEELAPPPLNHRLTAAAEALYEGYQALYEGLLAYHRARGPAPESCTRTQARDQEVAAKEDARYLLPMATTGQLGMTVNARSLEGMVRRLKGSRLAEVRTLADLLEEAALSVTPSLVRYTEPTPADACLERPLMRAGVPAGALGPERVRLLHATPDGDALLEAADAALTSGEPLAGSREGWGRIPGTGQCADRYFAAATQHSRAPRYFELVDLLFEVTCSAACFGQLKRHRMATVLPLPYDLSLEACVPPSVREAGLEASFLAAADLAGRTAAELHPAAGDAAAYLLTNAHCRRVVVKMNLRELYHFTRLRMDGHAQWEIRALARDMACLAATGLPGTARYLCGKDEFDRVRGERLSP